MRAAIIILVASSIFTGAALVRGVTYALTHALGIEQPVAAHQLAER